MIPWWGSHCPTDPVPTIAESLSEANRLLAAIAARTAMETTEVKVLQKRVEATRTMLEGIAVLLQQAAGADPDTATIAALTKNLASSTDALAAAVAAKQ